MHMHNHFGVIPFFPLRLFAHVLYTLEPGKLIFCCLMLLCGNIINQLDLYL